LTTERWNVKHTAGWGLTQPIRELEAYVSYDKGSGCLFIIEIRVFTRIALAMISGLVEGSPHIEEKRV